MEPVTFNAPLEAHHQHIDPAAWNDIYIVGDVHGCLDALDRLLARLDPTGDDLVLFVGDLVRKGPDSPGVFERVRRQDNFRSVRGNNEQKLIDGRDPPTGIDSTDVATMATFPLAISLADSIVVHGGLDHRKPHGAHGRQDLLELRSLHTNGYERPYWFERRTTPPRVFFGHTVLAEPLATDWAVGLDTGCVYGGRLTAYDWRADRFVSVPPDRTYRSRSDDGIVTPRPVVPRTDR